ncbi:MAG: hypothetical protein EZS28_012447 [Streblomastix strix]|uniref:Protein kinase domain-containing protein n=1 Tax=Streblomastix strix TaxID=222440 RepID=A0A5J4WBI9_9EUKA|nr:MAG: hypothetical protein EZS28_012447 [Streblomastix strix]
MNTTDQQSPKFQLQQGDVVKGRYILGPQIGAGAFGLIFAGKTIGGELPTVALKFEQINAPQPQLTNEMIVMNSMEGNKHFTKFYHHGSHKNYKFIAMSLLGPSLIDLVNSCPPY